MRIICIKNIEECSNLERFTTLLTIFGTVNIFVECNQIVRNLRSIEEHKK